MRKSILAALVALPLLAGCAGQVTPVPANVDVTIQTSFTALDFALGTLAVIPGIPPNVVAEAQKVDAALQAAYTAYKANPNDTQLQAAVTAAEAAVQKFLASQAKNPTVDKALHAPPVAR